MQHDNFRLGLNDRVRYNGEFYRPERRDEQRRHWVLRRLVDGSALDGHRWHLTERDHYRLRRSDNLLVEEEYFSLPGRLLSGRADDSDLSDLTEAEQLTVAWKVEWCTRFYRARALLDGYTVAPPCTPDGLTRFIDRECKVVHRWYINTFGKSRPLGRVGKNGERKEFDYPGPTTLREWMAAFEAKNYKKKAFRPEYRNCGNRNQIDPIVAAIIQREARGYASRAKPTVSDIYERVIDRIDKVNRGREPHDALWVSERAVRRRVRQLHPVFVDSGRLGIDVARRKYMPVGQGLETVDGLEPLRRMDRVEMDDWEMDLFALLNTKQVLDRLSPEARKKAQQVDRAARCTVTWAIDVATRCIVGLNVSPNAPSCAGSRGALHTMLVDKSPMAKAAKTLCEWTMFAKPREIATDGGPVFLGDFHETAEQLGIDHRYAGGDPRRRGHVEASFRQLKRFCRKFTGQAFANVVMRGDYDSSRCASLLAQNLEKLIIKFIVDDYHQRPHDELGGARPQTVWEQAGNELIAPPDHVRRRIAFGIRLKDRTIDAAGVTFLHIQYKHPKMALLHGSVGQKRLTAIVDPHDLGKIFVRIPEEAKRHFDRDDDYMVFTARTEFNGVAALRHMNNSAALRAMEREENAAGRPFRLDAHRVLGTAAEKARIRAGVAPDALSNERFLKLFAEFERAGLRATKPRPAPTGAPMAAEGEPDILGTSMAKPAGPGKTVRHAAPGKPAARSINKFEEDDQ